jgi:hypothetical protein
LFSTAECTYVDSSSPAWDQVFVKDESSPLVQPRTQAAASSPSTPARSLNLATDLYKSTVVCLFLVICAWVRGWDESVTSE